MIDRMYLFNYSIFKIYLFSSNIMIVTIYLLNAMIISIDLFTSVMLEFTYNLIVKKNIHIRHFYSCLISQMSVHNI